MEIFIELLWRRLDQARALFPFLAALEERFPAGEIYLVGGAVRDLLLGRETKDYDFLIRGIPAEALKEFLRSYGKVNWVGKSFGVYKFMPKGLGLEEPIDIALPRTERSFMKGGGRRDFEVQSDPQLPVEEDLRRRDFTVNAIAADLKQKRLIDPFGGVADLKSGLLRAVGEPAQRFAEDTSRLLRGLRFACQFGFDLEEKTWRALCGGISALSAVREEGTPVVPREIVAKEFVKAVVSDPVRAFDLWDESGAFRELIPELLRMKGCPQPEMYHTEGDVWTHTRLALSILASPAFQEEFGHTYDAETALAVLFHDIGKPYTLQTPERHGVDRIRFNNHDQVGARLAREISGRLKLSSYAKGSRYHVDEEALAWLIEKHLILVHGEVDQLRAATIEKNFLTPYRPGAKLLQLIFCDGSATIPPAGAPQLVYYHRLRERIRGMEALSAERSRVPPPLLSGGEVMELLGLSPGPEVGKCLALLREEQLSGRVHGRPEAVDFIRKQQLKNGRE
ncbi:MAG: CCA tRNA nucleotidyltransferase [Nitrospirae bacterium]|nr:CCA tRNA nucleotidyltransferase [Candidatus Manganitrophaceae bacterium]